MNKNRQLKNIYINLNNRLLDEAKKAANLVIPLSILSNR